MDIKVYTVTGFYNTWFDGQKSAGMLYSFMKSAEKLYGYTDYDTQNRLQTIAKIAKYHSTSPPYIILPNGKLILPPSPL
jgi:hypothetical protein